MDPIYVTNSVQGGNPTNSNALVLTLGTPEPFTTVGVDIYQLPFAFNFSLKQLSQYTDIVNICDRYKIMGALIKVSYNANQAWGTTISQTSTLAGQGQFMPILNWITDHDDDGVQTSAQLRARQGLKQRNFTDGRSLTMACVPKPAPIVYDGVASSYSIPATPQWINSGYPDTPHFGIKGYLQNVPLGSDAYYASCFTFDITLLVKCADLQ